jgi:hypothetical protein
MPGVWEGCQTVDDVWKVLLKQTSGKIVPVTVVSIADRVYIFACFTVFI